MQETCVQMGKSKREFGKRSRQHEASEGGRTVRLQELIREEVNFLLRSEATDARLQSVVVTFVELTRDGSCARLWFTAEGATNRAEALERAGGFLRNRLAESLGLKRTPELRFRRDPTTRTLLPLPGEVL
jgi:ribosome-binding factor A